MSKHLQFTIGLPSRNRIKFCNEALKTMLKNSKYPIIVVDDFSDNPDGKYLKDKRIKVIYNKKKMGLTTLWNQIIKESKTEYVIIAGDKLRPKKKDFALIEKKLNEGFALVAPYMMGFFGFSKHLTTKIGMMDEGYKFSGYEDTDLMNKLFINNLAFYFSTQTKYIQIGSGWKPNTYNKNYYKKKWFRDQKNKALIQIREDFNNEEINLFKDKFKSRVYLPFSKSRLLYKNVKNFYKDINGYKNIKVSNKLLLLKFLNLIFNAVALKFEKTI